MILGLVACIGLQKTVPDTGDTGATPAYFAGLAVSDTTVDFGTVAPDEHEERTLRVENQTENVVDVLAALAGEAFEVDTTSLMLAQGRAEVLTLGFWPDDAGSYAGVLTLSAGGESLEVTLTGEAREEGDSDTDADSDSDTDADADHGDIEADTSKLDFGTIGTGDSSLLQVTVSNVGSGPLEVTSAKSSDSVFTLGGNLTPPRTLDPGDERIVEVTFSPTSATTYGATLTIESDDPREPELEIILTGKGEETCSVCSPRIDVSTGGDPYAMTDFFSAGSADSKSVSIGNDGDEVLKVTDINVNNDLLAPCGEFKLSSWTGSANVAPGDTTSFTISYTATETCVDLPQKSFDMNVVHILSNDPAEPDYIIELGGLGF